MDVRAMVDQERADMVVALEAAGPEAPTLCEGWTARDLAAHVVARDRRPDSLPGVAVPPLAGWTERVRQGYARRPFPELLDLLRQGPPPWSPFALPGAHRAEITERFVHHEDVRRSAPGWEPRDLSDDWARLLWTAVSRAGAIAYRRSPVGVVLAVPGGPRRQVRQGEASVVLTGPPAELLLHATGRTGAARVDISGPDDAVDAFRQVRLAI